MSNIRKIITLLGQQHNYKNLGELFTEATEEEKEDILKALGLDEILIPGGGFIPKYSVDITSNKPTFITKDFDITLTSRVYNFFDLVPDTDVTSWAWTRDSGDPAADTTWALGKSTKAIVLTSTDFPGIATGDITFSLTVTVKGKVITDTITFTKTISDSRLRIKSTAQVFVDNLPEKAILSEDFDGVIETYSWFLNDIFRASTPTFRVDYSDLIPGEIGEIKLEATTDLGEILTDVFLIPRLKNGENGTDGIPGPSGTDGSPRYIWIKYADDDLGTDMSDVPTKVDGSTRAYIGIAVNRTVQTESTNYLDYTWSKYVGNPGPKGVAGPSPRILEFVPGGTYENGELYIDYVYFRSSNPATEGYYTVKLPSNHIPGTKVTVVYPGGIPNIDPTTGTWVKAPFTKEMSFGTVVAEQANLAGFIFRNGVLTSQTGAKMVACHPEAGVEKKNLTLDGILGIVSFLDRMVMDKTGIILKDDCGKRRMAFQWGLAGVPILKFFGEDGITVTWEAGKNGFQDYITTVPESYAPLYALYKATTPDGSFLEGKAVFTSSNMCNVNDIYSPSGKAYYYRQPNTPEEIKGYYYDKGVQPSYLPAQESGSGKYFTTADYNGTLVPDGWYLSSFSTFVEGGENKTKGMWIKITAGIEVEQLEVAYAEDPSLPTCNPTQLAQWQTGY